jgi:hypothetical protein
MTGPGHETPPIGKEVSSKVLFKARWDIHIQFMSKTAIASNQSRVVKKSKKCRINVYAKPITVHQHQTPT